MVEHADISPLGGSAQGVGEGSRRAWDETTDVLVAGFGAAGAAAALEANERGAAVLLCDRFFGGGSTALSGGVVYLGGGTELQVKAGYADTAEEMYKYVNREAGGVVDERTVRAFCDQSVENFAWLRGLGVPFVASGKAFKTSYPPDECTLYFSGNEISPPYAGEARPAPRGHRALGKGLTGNVIFDRLRRAVAGTRIDFRRGARVHRLVTGGDGRVLGAELSEVTFAPARGLIWLLWLAVNNLGALSAPLLAALQGLMGAVERVASRRRYVRARAGVVLTTGGFAFIPAMMRAHAPAYARGSMRLGTAGDVGDGIRLGQGAGGAVTAMERCCAFRFVNPPTAFTHGVFVGPGGERICNEEYYGATLGKHMTERHGGKGWLVLDAAAMRQARTQLRTETMGLFQLVFGYLNAYVNCKRAATLQELAAKCGVPAAKLEATIAAYNQAVAEHADPLGKSEKAQHVLAEGPFYAVRMDIDTLLFLSPYFTLGGLTVDGPTARVLRADGTVIEGLYAAGRTAAGVSSNSYVSGLSVADCIFSGRNAGRHAAGVAKDEDRSPMSADTRR
jgi:3-oxo-5alpha-steroid 4-dehydrogenase